MDKPEIRQVGTELGFSTAAIRTQATKTVFHEHSVPIFMTSSYAFDDPWEAEAKFAGTMDGPIYSRYSNPNIDELAEKVRRLEGAEDAITCSSGMAAIFSAITGLLSQGDHIVSAKAVFGSTYGLLANILPRFGITTTFVDVKNPQAWEDAIKPSTKMLFTETPTNPGLDLADLRGLGDIAKRHGIILATDNCFATPYLQNPLALGSHLVTHSTTKFMDGQGRTIGGIVAGRADLVEQIRLYARATGPALSPFNAWTVSKGLETLAVRMEAHCKSALSMAQYLEGLGSKGVLGVRYPFLESHPQYALAKSQMRHGGAMVSFDLGTKERSMKFLNSLSIISCSANLGDTRSIITHPATTTHAKVPLDLRNELGVTEGLVRMSVGLEDLADLQGDIYQALLV